MHIKPMEKITAAYGLNSLKAYLEGKQNLKWIASIIGSDTSARQMLSGLAGYGRPERYRELSDWLASVGVKDSSTY